MARKVLVFCPDISLGDRLSQLLAEENYPMLRGTQPAFHFMPVCHDNVVTLAQSGADVIVLATDDEESAMKIMRALDTHPSTKGKTVIYQPLFSRGFRPSPQKVDMSCLHDHDAFFGELSN